MFKSSSTSKKPPAASSSCFDNDLLPKHCTSPEHDEVYQDALALCRQQLISASVGVNSSSNSVQQDKPQPDAALLDFWLLLQQTQSNLQVRLPHSLHTQRCVTAASATSFPSKIGPGGVQECMFLPKGFNTRQHNCEPLKLVSFCV